MINTVYDLIKALTDFEPNTPVVYRKLEGGVYFTDWHIHRPTKFFPGDTVCLSSFEQVKEQSGCAVSQEESQ